jgi:hypothetical protein
MDKRKYVLQLRRGWKWDVDPETGKPRNDWEKFTEEQPDMAMPKPGELVLEYDNGIPRLKIGDGIHSFAELEYMSVDSFLLPKTASVHIDPSQWRRAEDGDDDRYYQVVTVQNAIITKNSQVDLHPTSDDIEAFRAKALAFVAENWDGQVRVYCIGETPKNPYDIPVTVTEVICNV